MLINMLSQLLYACYILHGDILEILLSVETAIPTIKKGAVIAMIFGGSSATVKQNSRGQQLVRNLVRPSIASIHEFEGNLYRKILMYLTLLRN